MRNRSEFPASGNTDAQLEQLLRHTAQLQQELDAARAEIEQLHQDTHRWWSVADKYRRELLSVYASKSWRMTWPMRQVRLSCQALVMSVWRTFSQVPRRSKQGAKTFLLWAIRRVLVTPRFRTLAERLLAYSPNFRRRLRAMVLAPTSQLIEVPTPNRQGGEQHLSERAASVYDELCRALEARKR